MVTIDLSAPLSRVPQNQPSRPRPSIVLYYNDAIITESAIVCQFLVDAHPSHLEKTSSEEGGALQRGKINFFVDTYFTKVISSLFGVLRASAEEKEKEVGAFCGCDRKGD